jgi:MerR family transcriptional regulator, heat shock protein HspR
MQGFVDYVRTEMLSRMQQQASGPGLVPIPRPAIVPPRAAAGKAAPVKAVPMQATVLTGKNAAKGPKPR